MTETPDTYEPGSAEYDAATSPHNSITPQHPALVARPADADAVAALVRQAASRGLTFVPQATGHGAGAPIGDGVLLIDTSDLDHVSIDVETRTAVVGAGATWEQVNGAAYPHGLLGRAGSSPSVAMCGYSFGGGIGWMVRPYGLQSGALTRVEYVDGAGTLRTASDDAVEPLDRDAMFAFRGGGGVGIATELAFDLVPFADLHAGYLLWRIEHLDAVVDAWARAIGAAGDHVATSIAVLRVPPAPDLPADLRGTQAVHLAIASNDGAEGALPLLRAMRGAAEASIDTWGPSDLERLGGIHLDPPPGTPAIGRARWLTADAPSIAVAALRAAVDSPIAMVEIRSVGDASTDRPGAEADPPGPFLLHAVGAPSDDVPRDAVEAAFDAVLAVASPADAGRSAGSWVEGAASVPDALPAESRERILATADALDPDRVLARSRYLS